MTRDMYDGYAYSNANAKSGTLGLWSLLAVWNDRLLSCFRTGSAWTTFRDRHIDREDFRTSNNGVVHLTQGRAAAMECLRSAANISRLSS